MNRRDFLKHSSLAAAGTLMVPFFLKAIEKGGSLADGDKILVVLQLSGGNDGLNTLVPYRNDLYYQARPAIGIDEGEVLDLDGEQGFHPNLKFLADLYQEGELSILNSVGYPNPNRSHFRSMDIWQTGSPSDVYWSTGWIGRFLDAKCDGGAHPYTAIEVDDALSLALKGDCLNGIAAGDPKRFHQTATVPYFRRLAEAQEKAAHNDSPHGYLYKTLVESVSSADYIYETYQLYRSTGVYPAGPLGKHLRTTAEMIISGLNTRVYYLSFGGFDTHVNQPGQHARLLKQLDSSLAVFCGELKKKGKWKDTMVMVFSEFGRRVKQNASRGTDHGTANNVYLLGGGLKKPGIYNPGPDLANLDKGDLKYQVDFRRVYAELLNRWLKADGAGIMQGKFDPLGIV